MDFDALRPFNKTLLIQMHPVAEQIGSIYLPSSTKNGSNMRTAMVLAVGTGAESEHGHTIRPRSCVGNTVLLYDFTGTDIVDGDRVLRLVNEDDLLGVIGGSNDR